MALHALILQWAGAGFGPGRQGLGAQAILVRRIELPAPAVAAQPEGESSAQAARQESKPRTPHRAPAARAPRLAEPAVLETAAPAAAVDPPQPRDGTGTERGAGADGTATPAWPLQGGGTDIPVYATAIAPPLSLSYELRRNALVAEGELHWRHDGQRYELTLQSRTLGRTLLDRLSQGGFDRAGVAPLRYVEKRRGREWRAVNFQREAGKISYSAATHDVPLVAGAQDRLSWMAQLAAIVGADPARWRPGEHIVILVAGARGEADVWRFEVLGEEVLEPEAAGPTALHLRRQPTRAYDPQWDVWLGAAQGYWPLRALQTVQPAGDITEWLLKPVPQVAPR